MSDLSYLRYQTESGEVYQPTEELTQYSCDGCVAETNGDLCTTLSKALKGGCCDNEVIWMKLESPDVASATNPLPTPKESNQEASRGVPGMVENYNKVLLEASKPRGALGELIPHRGALQEQEGGDHYKKLKIQPVEYAYANKLDFAQANIVKYITRHKDKGEDQDIRKIMHYCKLILKFEYGIDE